VIIHSFVIQAARPINNRRSNDIKAHTNIKTQKETEGKL